MGKARHRELIPGRSDPDSCKSVDLYHSSKREGGNRAEEGSIPGLTTVLSEETGSNMMITAFPGSRSFRLFLSFLA